MSLFLVLVSQHPEKNTHLWVTVLKEQATDFLGQKDRARERSDIMGCYIEYLGKEASVF